MNAALDQILTIPARSRSRLRFGCVLLLAFASHLGVGAAASTIRRVEGPRPMQETEIRALPEEVPPPPAPLPPAQQSPEPDKATPQPFAQNAPAVATPLPAVAGNVMTATDDAPADLTGGMVVGAAETYGGGAVTPNATAARAGTAAPPATSAPKTALSSPAPRQQVDRSHPPKLADGVSWNCSFPAEADEKGIDDAVVGLGIDVAPNGQVINVTVERDPGAGFGRAAASCARSKRFSPAEDRDGHPIAGRARVNVRFHR